jgi:glucose/mannose-6-phosphate isomerase
MTARVVGFPAQLRAAWELAGDGGPLLAGLPRRVYVVGMGGSAIGGDFVRAYAAAEGKAPVEVVRGYGMPRPADHDSFAFFVSYSGNTEETLSAWEEASARGIPRAVITSGGELLRRAESAGVPRLVIPSGSPPRAALGWTSVPLFRALAAAGVIPVTAEDLEEAASACEEVVAAAGPDAPAGPVRQWAESLPGRLPVVLAPDAPYGVVATRWACQLNENAKVLAHAALFPEHNHNEIVGWEADSAVRNLVDVAVLTDGDVHPRVARRLDLFESVARDAGRPVTRFAPRGRGLLARLYSLALVGDFASLWLAAALSVDPTPVASIDRLKAELGRS